MSGRNASNFARVELRKRRCEYTTDILGHSSYFTYDYNGRLTRSVDPLGNASQSFYTNDGRLTKTRSAGGGESRYGYFGIPGRQHLLYNTQQVIDEGDPQDPLDDIVAETTFAYDPNGRMIATIDPNGQGSGFDYDLDGRVTQSRYTWVDPAGTLPNKVIATGMARRLHRVRLWVTGKLLINAARLRCSKRPLDA